MEEIQIYLPIKAVPQNGWKTGKFGQYMPAKVRQYKEDLSLIVSQTYKGELFSGALSVDIDFNFIRPKSAPKRKFHTVRPDRDNLVKPLMDCLEGVVFKDDSQVITGRISKSYSDKNYILVTIKELIHA